MQYILPDKVYNVIKWACLIALPALATLVSAIGSAWGADASLLSAISTTITAIMHRYTLKTMFGYALDAP